MALKNVTITLDEEVLRVAKHRAVDRGLSLSRYVAEVLSQEHGRAADDYVAAHERWRRLMEKGVLRGWDGKVTWTRDELHER